MKFWNKMKKNSKGFTLVEIIVVLVILAVLAAFTIPSMIGFVADARGKTMVSEAREVYVAAQATATECNAMGVDFNEDDLGTGENGLNATNLSEASKKMKDYLSDDIDISDDTTPDDGDGAYWTVTFNSKNEAKIESVTFLKDGYEVTITAGDGSEIDTY